MRNRLLDFTESEFVGSVHYRHYADLIWKDFPHLHWSHQQTLTYILFVCDQMIAEREAQAEIARWEDDGGSL